MRFDSGPEGFVRVNRNYVLTEYVLNENDCKLLILVNSKNLRTIRKLIAYENFQDYSKLI